MCGANNHYSSWTTGIEVSVYPIAIYQESSLLHYKHASCYSTKVFATVVMFNNHPCICSLQTISFINPRLLGACNNGKTHECSYIGCGYA